MWKNNKQIKKRQEMAKWIGGQLKGKVVVGAAIATGAIIEAVIEVAVAIGEKAIKEDKGEIQDEEALDTLFNKII